MQQPGEKIRHSRLYRRKQSTKSPHISSFGMLNRNGLEISIGMNLPAVEEEKETRESALPSGPMPEQQQGYIKCRKHDFF